jgi:hypothetical protein
LVVTLLDLLRSKKKRQDPEPEEEALVEQLRGFKLEMPPEEPPREQVIREARERAEELQRRLQDGELDMQSAIISGFRANVTRVTVIRAWLLLTRAAKERASMVRMLRPSRIA